MREEKASLKDEKIMIEVLNLLQEKSKRALNMAKKEILSEKIEGERARGALKYYVENWDDTTHPGVLMLACEAVGGDPKKAKLVQVAMLYLTAATDLHDDVLDESTVKNGKPTVFGKYGKGITILLGNAMMIKGFEFLCRHSSELTQGIFEAVASTIKTDFYELGNASLMEIDLKGRTDVSPEKYLRMLEKKASSVKIHTKIGAIVGGGSSDEIEALETYGKILGLLVNLREDFIDIFEPDELKNRMENETLPIPILYAFKNSETKNKITRILAKPKISEEEALEIVDYVFKSKHVKELGNHLKDLTDTALNSITDLEEVSKKNLTLLIHGALEDISNDLN